jgi:murein L,D-transpeptidase YcbB/YkuD
VKLALICAVLLSAAGSAPPPNQQLHELVGSGALSDLRWPNFARIQPDVARFYDSNGYQLVWVRAGSPTPQAQALIRVLQNAALKGLGPQDYEFGSDAGLERFDLALTISAMRYISDVSSGKVDPAVFSFGLHFDQRKCDLAEALRALVDARDVDAELNRLEPPFEGYWRTEKALAEYLARPQENPQHVRQLQLVLERWRWVPHAFPRPPIVVNIPEFRLRAYDDQYRPELEMKVVVGKAYRHKTPVFSNEMTHVIFRPYWDVPLSIQRAELVPKIAKDPAYLAKNDYEVVNAGREVVSSDVVSPEMLAELRSGKLFIRQVPGDKNALGSVKFLFPNEYNVYLHGTPAKSLFLKSRRDFSHGCIRVEKPEELAQWVLRGVPGWDMDRIAEAENATDSRRVDLDKPIPVLILYGTARVREDGEVVFFDDIYGHDAALAELLDHGYPYSGWQPTSAARGPRRRE